MAKNTKHHTDDDLVKMVAEGKKHAFAELMKRYETIVRTTVFNIVKDNEQTNDICQDVFIKVYCKIKEGKYTCDGKFNYWIGTIARNEAVDYHRDNKYTIVELDETKTEYSTSEITPKNPKDSYQEHTNSISDYDPTIDLIIQQLEQIIQEAPEHFQRALKMKYYEDLSLKEIAEKTNSPIGTVSSDIHYAKIWVRKRFEKTNRFNE